MQNFKNIIIIFMAIIIGGLGYKFFSEKDTLPAQIDDRAEIVATPLASPLLPASPQASPVIENEEEIIQAAVKEQLLAKHEGMSDNLLITVSKISGNYAQGGVQEIGIEVGGGMWFAAQVNNEWQLVWDGNGSIYCSDLTDYPNFPTSMIPECYDEVNMTVVKR